MKLLHERHAFLFLCDLLSGVLGNSELSLESNTKMNPLVKKRGELI